MIAVLGRALSPLQRLTGYVLAAAVLAMMALTMTDVVARYVFTAPIGGAYEMIQILMALVVFLGLPLVTARGEHISIGLLDGVLGRRLDWWRQLIVLLVSTGVIGFVAGRLWDQARSLAASGMSTQYLDFPIAIIAFACTLLTVAAAASLVARLWVHLGLPRANEAAGRDRP